MKNLNFIEAWDKSYLNNDNMLLYPNEEVIKFVNKFLNKRIDLHNYEIEFDYPPKIVDLGCGAGRHLLFFVQNGFYPIGIDISKEALKLSKQFLDFHLVDNKKYELKLIKTQSIDLQSNSIDHAIAHGSLDSMPTADAIEYSNEIYRLLKPKGFFYVEVIGNDYIPDSQKEIGILEYLVTDDFESNTIQNYYNQEKIAKVFNQFEIIFSKKIYHQVINFTNKENRKDIKSLSFNILILQKR